MLKRSTVSAKHLCGREKCMGALNDRENYLGTNHNHLTSRDYHKSRSAAKHNNKHRSALTLKLKEKIQTKALLLEELKSELNITRKENQLLTKKLDKQELNVQKLKEKIHSQNLQIEHYQKQVNDLTQTLESLHANKENNNLKSNQPQADSLEKQCSQLKKQLAQLKRQYELYQQESHKKSHKLQISLESVEQQLKQSKLSSSPTFNHHFDKPENADLLKQVRRLEQELICKHQEIVSSKQQFSRRESELMQSLNSINSKVCMFDKEYQNLMGQLRDNEEKYKRLAQKYRNKQNKSHKCNEEWGHIFKEVMVEVDRLKNEMHALTERNMRLIKNYAHSSDE